MDYKNVKTLVVYTTKSLEGRREEETTEHDVGANNMYLTVVFSSLSKY